jgi:ornithine cyclodeaminase/alanine dehydrogenase-like protein (mu-crystallin family)
MASAHCAVRPIKRVSVYGRRPDRVDETVAAILSLLPPEVKVNGVASLAETVPQADIVSCATSSITPVLEGRWLQPGAFVDLVGSFSPTRREADDTAVTRSRIFVDTFEGALSEAGDLLDPLSRGIIDRSRIEGELSDLVRGRVEGRRDDNEIILFKSVGTAIEDLALSAFLVASTKVSARLA